jgi:hypothetical protein
MTLTITDLPERIASRIVVDEHGCWVWQGWKNSGGYGYVRWDGRDQPIHRVVFQLTGGVILDDAELDHRCRNRACCRPKCLEPVSHAENQRRLSAAQISCRRAGHDWSNPRNVARHTNGRRYCAECAREGQRRRYAARKAVA